MQIKNNEIKHISKRIMCDNLNDIGIDEKSVTPLRKKIRSKKTCD